MGGDQVHAAASNFSFAWSKSFCPFRLWALTMSTALRGTDLVSMSQQRAEVLDGSSPKTFDRETRRAAGR
jgi:hypothetical protein